MAALFSASGESDGGFPLPAWPVDKLSCEATASIVRSTMKKSRYIISLFVCVVVLAACSSAPTPTPAASTATQPLPAVVSASGKVLPEQWANLSFRAGGPIIALKAQSGDSVKAGDVIAQLDDVDAKLAVAQADAALAVAQAQLA